MKMRNAMFMVLMIAVPLAAGCAAESPSGEDEPMSQDSKAAGAQDIEALGSDPDSEALAAAGCSNAEIRIAQIDCRNVICAQQNGSRGIHFCRKEPSGCLYYQCDCVSPPDWATTLCP